MTAATVAGDALVVAGKDLRIESRARVGVAQILPFGALVLVLFAFALDPQRHLLPHVFQLGLGPRRHEPGTGRARDRAPAVQERGGARPSSGASRCGRARRCD